MLGIMMGTKPKISLLLAAVLLGGSWSTSNADSFKVVTAPSAGQEPSAQSNSSSMKVITVPSAGQEPSAQSNSSMKVATAPPGDQVGQGASQTDEQPPGAEPNPNPGPQFRPNSHHRLQPRADCSPSPNGATLPCATIQQIILPPGTGRTIHFDQKYSRVIISDSDVVDVELLSEHDFLVKPSKEQTKVQNGNTTYTTVRTIRAGNADLFVYDAGAKLIGEFEVLIDSSAYRTATTISDPLAGIEPPPLTHSVDIYGLGPTLTALFG